MYKEHGRWNLVPSTYFEGFDIENEFLKTGNTSFTSKSRKRRARGNCKNHHLSLYYRKEQLKKTHTHKVAKHNYVSGSNEQK